MIDPESMLDATRDVAIDGRRVSAVSEERLDGKVVIDVSGLVVAPGFIDLHSHAQTLAGRRLQACDGVTAALDLEAGEGPRPGRLRPGSGHGLAHPLRVFHVLGSRTPAGDHRPCR